MKLREGTRVADELFTALLPPLALFFLWHWFDAFYPRNDESFYFEFPQEIYRVFKHSGLGYALNQAYFHRHWKPVLHPLFAIPFLGASGGAVRPALTGTLALFYGVFLAYAYSFARRYLGRMRSALTTWILALIPWTLGVATTFNSELPLMACSMAAFYHLSRIDDFLENRQSFLAGAWIALSVCVRPVESALMFFLPVTWLLAQGYRKKLVLRRDLYLAAAWLLLLVLALLPPGLRRREWDLDTVVLIDLYGLIGLFVTYWLSRRFNLRRGVQVVLIIPVAGALLWFAPGAATLFDWAFATSFGSLASSGFNQNSGHLMFIFNILKWIGVVPWILLPMGCLALRSKAQLKEALSGQPALLISAVMFAFVVFSGALTQNGGPRYYFAAGAILTVNAAVFALQELPTLKRARIGMALTLLVVQAFVIQNIAFGKNTFFNPYDTGLGNPYWDLRTRSSDPLLGLYDELSRKLDPNGTQKIELLFLDFQDESWMTDPWGLSIVSREHDHDWTFNREGPQVSASAGQVERVEWFKKHYDYLLVGPVGGTESPFFREGAPTALFLIDQWKSKALGKFGLQVVASIPINAPGRPGTDLLLMKTSRERRPDEDRYH